jgi:hypothetical protein
VPAPGRSQRRRGTCISEEVTGIYAYRKDLTNGTTPVAKVFLVPSQCCLPLAASEEGSCV